MADVLFSFELLLISLTPCICQKMYFNKLVSVLYRVRGHFILWKCITAWDNVVFPEMKS